MDPYNEKDRQRFFQATQHSWRQLEPFRRMVHSLVEEYTGPAYGYMRYGSDTGSARKREILINLMNQAVDAYTMALAANRPRVLVTTQKEHLRYFARQYQEAVNNLIEEIGLEITLREAVLNAFFCVGIVKLHMANAPEVQIEDDVWMDPGQPFASSISIDNWCHDMAAPRYSQVSYAGDSYRMTMRELQEGPYDQDIVAQLTPTSKNWSLEEERLENISRGLDTDLDEYEPSIDLMDMWIPETGKIFTFAMETKNRFQSQFPPLAEMEWTGSEHGPYRMLSFNDVPENTMPTSPASHVAGLSRLANNLMRKAANQAQRQQDIFTYTPAGAESAKKIKRSGDGDWVEVQDTKEVGQMKQGGVDPGNQAFMVGTIQMFDRMSGNLSAKLGLGPQAETVGQEQLIHGAVSAKEASLQNRTVDFATGIITDLGKMLWDDQVKVIPGRIQVDGAPDYSTDATWYPGRREGEHHDYTTQVDAYSMMYQSPQQRAEALNALLTGVYIPLAEMLTMQGGMIDLQEVAEVHAELYNLPRLKRMIRFAAPPDEGLRDQAAGPNKTTREYVRRNVAGGGTQQGQARSAQQDWLAMAASNANRPQGGTE